MNFLERCEVCAYMAIDKDVGDMICTLDGQTCRCVEFLYKLEGITSCDAFEQAYEFEDLRGKECE